LKTNAVRLIYFSPTQTTRQVLEGISQAFPVVKKRLDLTVTEVEGREMGDISNDELSVIGTPVYAGRVSRLARRRLLSLKAHGTPAMVVVVYGNRDYDDALLELRDLAADVGFVPIAGAAFIGEHTANYALGGDEPLLCKGRPDAEDLRKALQLGLSVWSKLEGICVDLASAKGSGRAGTLEVPGNYPYRERGGGSPASPSTEEDLCAKCSICASVCPVGAITVNADMVMTDADACIMCCACVKHCQTGARRADRTWMGRAVNWLRGNCLERREPELYL